MLTRFGPFHGTLLRGSASTALRRFASVTTAVFRIETKHTELGVNKNIRAVELNEVKEVKNVHSETPMALLSYARKYFTFSLASPHENVKDSSAYDSNARAASEGHGYVSGWVFSFVVQSLNIRGSALPKPLGDFANHTRVNEVAMTAGVWLGR